MALNGVEMILASRDPEMGNEAVKKLKELDLDVSCIEVDVTNQESIHQAAVTINENYGSLYIEPEK